MSPSRAERNLPVSNEMPNVLKILDRQSTSSDDVRLGKICSSEFDPCSIEERFPREFLADDCARALTVSSLVGDSLAESAERRVALIATGVAR
jgi:hypothetical protein